MKRQHAQLRRRRERFAKHGKPRRPSGFERLEDRRLLATVVWDGGGDGSQWDIAANWAGDVLPGPGDDVVLPSGAAVTLDQDVQVDSVEITENARLFVFNSDLAADLRIAGRLTARGDVLFDGNVTTTNTSEIFAYGFGRPGMSYSGSANVLFSQGFVNQGTIKLQSYDYYNVHPVDVGRVAQIEIQNGTLLNQGYIETLPTSRDYLPVLRITGNIDNQGVVELQRDLDHGGQWVHAATGSIDVGVYDFGAGIRQAEFEFSDEFVNQGGSFSGGGLLFFKGTDISLEQDLHITAEFAARATAPVIFGQGTLVIDQGAGLRLGASSQVSSPIEVAGTLIADNASFSGGVLVQPTGTFSVRSGSTSGDAFLTVTGGVINHGLIDMRNDTGSARPVWLSLPDSQLFNAPGATIHVYAGGERTIRGAITNQGEIIVDRYTVVSDLSGQKTFDNSMGRLHVESGARLVIQNDELHLGSGSVLTGGGVIEARRNVHLLDDFVLANTMASLQLGQSTTIHGPGTFTNQQGITLTSPTVKTLLINEGTLLNKGSSVFEATVTNRPGATLILQKYPADTFMTFHAGLENHGLVELQQGNGTHVLSVRMEGATFHNAPEGTVRTEAGYLTWITGDVLNEGLVEIDDHRLTINGSYLQTSGETRLLAQGMLAADQSDHTREFQGGTLSGVGTIKNNVLVSGGTVRPGDPTGALTFTGGYEQAASATLEVQIGATGYGQLAIAGSAALGGTLSISRIDGYEPELNDEFTILTSPNRNGEFATVTGRIISADKAFRGPVYSTTAATLMVGPLDGEILDALRDDFIQQVVDLRMRLTDWGSAFSLGQLQLPIVPDQLDALFGIQAAVPSLAEQLPTLDQAVPLNSLDDFRNLIVDSGYTVDCMLDESCPTTLFQVRRTMESLGLTAQSDFNDATTQWMPDLVQGADLDGTLDWTGDLTAEMIFGQDGLGRYVDGDSALTLSVVGGGLVSDVVDLAGALSIDLDGTAQYLEADPLIVASRAGSVAQRLRNPDLSVAGVVADGNAHVELTHAPNLLLFTYPGNWDIAIQQGQVTPPVGQPVEFPSRDQVYDSITYTFDQQLTEILGDEAAELLESLTVPLSDGTVPRIPGEADLGQIVTNGTFDNAAWFRQVLAMFPRLLRFDITPGIDRAFGGDHEGSTGFYYTIGDLIIGTHQLRKEDPSLSGQDIKIGVLSGGARNHASINQNEYGDLTPGKVHVFEGTPAMAGPTGDEGTAMMEIIHDIAPQADLYFASVSVVGDYATAFDWLIDQGVSIIVSDIGTPGTPIFDNRPTVAPLLAHLESELLAHDILFINSAGNAAQHVYYGAFAAGTAANTLYAFEPGVNTNLITVPAVTGQNVAQVMLQWDGPFDVPQLPQNETSLLWSDDLGNSGVAQNCGAGTGSQVRCAGFTYTNNTGAPRNVSLSVQANNIPADRQFALYSIRQPFFDGQLTPSWRNPSYISPGSSALGGPLVGGGAAWIQVGAVGVFDPGVDDPATYSSRGPSNFQDFTGAVLNQVDVAAPSSVSVSGTGGFGDTVIIDGLPRNIFSGTSAAAPHVAGMAALLKQLYPSATAHDLREAILQTARDLTLKPIAVDDVAHVDPLLTTEIDVLANDIDAGAFRHDFEADPFRFPLQLVEKVMFADTAGTVRIINGKLEYTPPSHDILMDHFGYVVEDDAGNRASAVVTVYLPHSSSVLAVEDAFIVVPNTTTTLDVLANDIPLGDSLADSLTAEPVSGQTTQGGTIATGPGDATLLYTPPAGFTGIDSFYYYAINNDTAEANSQYVTVVVGTLPAGNDPIITWDMAVLGNTLSVTVDVLDNDLSNSPLTLTHIQGAGDADAHISYQIDGDQIIISAKDNAVPGEYQLQYFATDGVTSADGRLGIILDATVDPTPAKHVYVVPDLQSILLDPLASEVNVFQATVESQGNQDTTRFLADVNNQIQFTPAADLYGWRTAAQEVDQTRDYVQLEIGYFVVLPSGQSYSRGIDVLVLRPDSLAWGFDQSSGYGMVNAPAAADFLADRFPPLHGRSGGGELGEGNGIVEFLDVLRAMGFVIEAETTDQQLTSLLRGDLDNLDLLQIRLPVGAEDFAPLAAELTLDVDTIGSLATLGITGSLGAELRPVADIGLGFDLFGFYLTDDTYVGGNIKARAQGEGSWDVFGIDVWGDVDLTPTINFSPADADLDGRLRIQEILDAFAQGPLNPIELSVGEVTANLDVDLVLGFMDYVDVDPALPNRAHGGDPFLIRGGVSVKADVDTFTLDDLGAFQFEFTDFRLANPDVNGDGVNDYTPGVFLANTLEFGWSLIEGIGLPDYLDGLASGLLGDSGTRAVTPGQPRGALPDEVPPTEDASRAATELREHLADAGSPNDSNILTTLQTWLEGVGDSALSVRDRIFQVDPASPSFLDGIGFPDFQARLTEALGNWERFTDTVDALWGGLQNLPAELAQNYEEAKQAIPRAIGEAIREAHDDAIALFASGAPARDDGDGYLDRAADAFRWAETASYLNLTTDYPHLSPRYVLEHFPVRVTIDRRDLVAQTEDRLLGPSDDALLTVKAGLQVKNVGVPLDEDPTAANYAVKFSAPVYETGEVVIRARGKDNNNIIAGPQATENSALDVLLELAGLPGIDWFDSESSDGQVALRTDATGHVLTGVRLGEGDTQAQIELAAGLAEVPLVTEVTNIELGRPQLELGAGTGGAASVSADGAVVGPGQSALIEARLFRGRGPLQDHAVTFYLLSDGSFDPRQDAIQVRTASRTSPEGRAYVEYFPPSGAIDTAVIGAVFFENGRVYTADISLPVVTSGADFAMVGQTVLPAILRCASSLEAEATRQQRQRLLEQSNGQLDPQTMQGLVPLIATWYDAAVYAALQAAEGSSLAFHVGMGGNLSFEQLLNRYDAAEDDARRAGEELLDWLAMISILGLELTPDLQQDRDAAATLYGQLMQQAIERNLAWFETVQVAIQQSLPRSDQRPGLHPLVEALRWSAAVDMFEPLSESLVGQDSQQRRTPWTRDTIIQESGLRVVWDSEPSVSGSISEATVSGQPRLVKVTDDEEEILIRINRELPAPLEIRLEPAGTATVVQNSFTIGSSVEYDPALDKNVTVAAPASFSTMAQAGTAADRLVVEVSAWFADYRLETRRVSIVPSPEIQLRGRSSAAGDDALAQDTLLIEDGTAHLRVDVRRGGGVVGGGDVRIRLIGEGTFSADNTKTDAAGVAEVVFVPPTVDVPPQEGDEYGLSVVTVSILDQGLTYTDSIQIRYRKHVAGGQARTDGSGFDTPDQELAAGLLADLIAVHTTVNSETNVPETDMVAVRNAAYAILADWWGAPGDYAALGADHPTGSVHYWLERLPQLPADLTRDSGDEGFEEEMEAALGNWSQWFAAAAALEISPDAVPGVSQAAARTAIAAALQAGIGRVNARCVARATEYQGLPDGSFEKRQRLTELVDEGLRVFGFYTAGRILEVFDNEPDTLEEILGALCYRPEISMNEQETFLDLGSSSSCAQLTLRAGIHVEGVEELLWVPNLPILIEALDGATVEQAIGSTDAEGYYRSAAIRLGTDSPSADIRVMVAMTHEDLDGTRNGTLTFTEQTLHLESLPELTVRVARASDGPSALSDKPPALVDGERMLVEVELRRGRSPLPGRLVFASAWGADDDTGGFDITQADGRVRFFVAPRSDDNGTMQIAVAFSDQGTTYTKSLAVPYSSTETLASLTASFSSAQARAAAAAGDAIGHAVVVGYASGQSPDVDLDQLEAAQRLWLEWGLNDPNEPLGLQARINAATLDTIVPAITEYERWLAESQRYGVDDRFNVAAIHNSLTTKIREAFDELLVLIWDPDPNQTNEFPSAGGARRLLELAAAVELEGLDRFAGDIDDDSYSFNALFSRLGYEMRIDTVDFDGDDARGVLTVQANYYLYESDPGPNGVGGNKIVATSTDNVPVVVDAVPFNAILLDQSAEKRKAFGGFYENVVELGPGVTDLVVDVLATDPEFPIVYDWQRQVRLAGSYRLESSGWIVGLSGDDGTTDPEISSHADTPQQAEIRAEFRKGNGLLDAQQVVAELTGNAPKGSLERAGEAGDRFVYTPPTGADNVPLGESGTQQIRLTGLINGQKVVTEIAVTYRNVVADDTSSTEEPGSFWDWITKQFDGLTTPLADGDQEGAGVGSSFGLGDIQFPSLSGSFNRAAGYAGGLLDWSLGAFDVLGTIDLQEIVDWLQNGPPTETTELIRMSLDLSQISAILSPTLLAADFSDLLPEGFTGQVGIDRPELTGQLVFGVDSSSDPFYILTRPDGFGQVESGQAPATEMGGRFGVFAQIDSGVELFGGLLGLDHAEGYLSTRLNVDWSQVRAGRRQAAAVEHPSAAQPPRRL